MKCKYYVTFLTVVAVLCALLMAGSLVTVTAADNLAANGDLELGHTSGWAIDNASLSSSVKYAGNYSLKLTSTTAYSGAAYKIVPVGRGADVTVSFYYRYDTKPSSSSKTYYVYTYKGDNHNSGVYDNASKSFAIPSSVTTWKKISYSFNSGDYANIYLKFSPGGTGSTACYIDNLVVTATGGTQEHIAPYLTSFGTRYNRPSSDSNNLIKNGGFESTDAMWNTTGFINSSTEVVADSTAPEGDKSLYFHSANTTVHSAFAVSVEPYTQYTFSAWVKSPRLSENNRATATFGIANAETGDFLVYEPYDGNGYGSSILSTTEMQLMATSPDDQWHLRSVTFYSGTATTVNVVVTGAESQLYLDDIALYKSAYGVEYISPLRSKELSATINRGNKYCADENSLIPSPHMTGKAAEQYWCANPAWRNGFLSFESVDDDHGTVLKYTASANTQRQLCYIDWIDVEPNKDYILTMDVKRLTAGNGRIMLLDDNVLSPDEFYTLSFTSIDSEWETYSIEFNSGVYSRIGFGIVDGGGQVYMDKIRLFKSVYAISSEPEEVPVAATLPEGGLTTVMEMSAYVPTNLVKNGDFEAGAPNSWDVYQGTTVTTDARHSGSYGAHLQGNGTWDAMLEQKNIPVTANESYSFSFWFKANANGANWTLKGEQSGTTYGGGWITAGDWSMVSLDLDCVADTSLVLNFCGGGNGIHENLYVDDISLTNSNDGPTLGVGFRIDLAATGVKMTETNKAYLIDAAVDVYGDGKSYSLKQMGCVATNQAQIGQSPTAFNLDNLDTTKNTVIDVPAVYLYQVTDTSVSYAVRVIDIPYRNRNTYVYVRPYYVFERDGKEVVVYGDIYSRSYTDANNSGSFAIS